jgi:superfamily II DNA or RNA helicase
MEEKKRRGRPPKNPDAAKESAASSVPAKAKTPAMQSVVEPAVAGAATAMPTANRKISTEYRFRLSRSTDGVFMSLVDRKGNPTRPEYRRCSGPERAVLREFAEAQRRSAAQLVWRELPAYDDDAAVFNPEPGLVDLAGSARMLVDHELRPLRYNPALVVPSLQLKSNDGSVQVVPVVALPEKPGLPAEGAPGGNTSEIRYAVSSRHVVAGAELFCVPEMGSFWLDATAIKGMVSLADLPVYLAMVLSKFIYFRLSYPGYTILQQRPREAGMALVFKEIDPYGYLHVRPVSFVPGYPPGFFEDQDITTVVELDDEARTLSLAEIVFPVDPADAFGSVLAGWDRGYRKRVFEEAGRFVLPPDFAEAFLSASLVSILTRFTLFQSEKLARYKLHPVKPRLKLALSSGIDFLEGSATVELGDASMPYGRFIAEYRSQGFIALNDGNRAFPLAQDVDRLERLVRKVKGEDDAVALSFFDVPALARSGIVEASGEVWKTAESFYTAYNDIGAATEKDSIQNGQLRPYQQYGIHWLRYLAQHGMGGCLADEMGLGKTIQVIALLRSVYAGGTCGTGGNKQDGKQDKKRAVKAGKDRRDSKEPKVPPSLIIVPKSLIHNWRAELDRFAPELSYILHYGSERDISAIKSGTADIVLSSYATARNDIEDLLAIPFNYLVLDESQNIKNIATKTAAAILAIQAQHRLALSGTPVENNLGELYSLFSFLMPGFFDTQAQFMRRYMTPIQEKGDDEALHDLRARIYPFILRRLKQDVLPELPPKTEQTVLVELDPAHLAAYHRRRVELLRRVEQTIATEGIHKSSFVILQAFTELRRLASIPEADGEYAAVSAKREYLRETIGKLSAGGHKCLVFANYLAAVDYISQDCYDQGLANLVMTGATSDRQSLVERFQTDAGIKAFIMTLKTGGVGLNLTAADYVFIFDPWWNRAAESQAIDRTHRIGQGNPVFCYRIIAKDTIEEKILELQERKAGLVSAVLSADTEVFKTMDADDIAYLMG